MPTITIAANGDAIVDGVNKGHFMDCHHNEHATPGFHAEIKGAVERWHLDQRDAVANAAKDRDAKVAAATSEIDRHKSIAAAAISDRDSAQTAVGAAFAALSAHPVIAGNDKARKIRELQAAANSAAEQLKALQA